VEKFSQIITELKKPFPPEAHKDRKLPGSGRWFFIPWQTIRERLDEVCPDWQCDWSEPNYVGDYCVIMCTLTIAGVSRKAPGNAPIILLSNDGKDMSRGTPIERAVADAFKNAAEAFGVARYLDDQKFVASYMSNKGDGRGYKYANENRQIEAGVAPVKPIKEDSGLLEATSGSGASARVISKAQASRLWAIARTELRLSDSDVKSVFTEFKVESTAEILMADYDKVIERLRNYSPAFV
jgi:hypothetical protein